MSESQTIQQAQDQPKPAEGNKPQVAQAEAPKAEPAKDPKADAPKEQPKEAQADAAREPAKEQVADAGKKPAEESKPSDTKPPEEKPSVVPEKYDLKLPKASYLEPAKIDEVASYAKEQGLSNEQAQALLDRENNAVKSFVERQQQELMKKPEAWLTETMADKEIGGEAFKQNAELAKRVVDRFGTDTFKQTLNATGLGNHPELVRFVARIGKQMGEDSLVLPGASGVSEKKSAAEILYPNQSK